MSLTYFLIDFENVQPAAADLKLIRGEDYRVRVFHGAMQNKFDVDVVKALQPLGSNVEYVQCERSGKNALDFHLAFYLGRLVEEGIAASSASKQKSRLVIVSKDSGFDALLSHIESLGHDIKRVADIREVLLPAKEWALVEPKPLPKSAASTKESAPKKAATPVKKPLAGKTQSKAIAAKPTPAPVKKTKPEPYERVIENLRDHPNNRPTTVLALERHLSTVLGKESSVEAVRALMQRLEKDGVALANGKKIEYKIPGGKS